MQCREILEPIPLYAIRSRAFPVGDLFYLQGHHLSRNSNIIFFRIIFTHSLFSQPFSILLMPYIVIRMVSQKPFTFISIGLLIVVCISVQLLVNPFLVFLEQSVDFVLFNSLVVPLIIFIAFVCSRCFSSSNTTFINLIFSILYFCSSSRYCFFVFMISRLLFLSSTLMCLRITLIDSFILLFSTKVLSSHYLSDGFV